MHILKRQKLYNTQYYYAHSFEAPYNVFGFDYELSHRT